MGVYVADIYVSGTNDRVETIEPCHVTNDRPRLSVLLNQPEHVYNKGRGEEGSCFWL